MGFSKKVKSNSGSGSSVSSDEWNAWNELMWDAFDVDAVTDAKGKEVKKSDVIGTLNFIMELGNQPQAPFAMKSNLPVPEEGEDNSPEELERLEKFPNNWFEWRKEWDNSKKAMVETRMVCWDQDPQETLVLAVDFPSILIDYNQHPLAESEDENLKPLRVDYNGKFKEHFERQVSNELNWKTGKFGDKDVKYKIATACNFLEEYQQDDHDLAHLVQATCNWELEMTRNESDGKVFYKIKIKNPKPIQDIKVRKDVYTVDQQLEDNKCEVPFTGILFDSDDPSDYTKDMLQQVRGFWWDQAKKSVQIDKNKGTDRDGEWLKGVNWKDSALYRAAKKYGFVDSVKDNTETEPENTSQKSSEAKSEDKEKKVTKSKPEPKSEPQMDFDDDIPFMPVGLAHNNSLLYVI